MTLLIVYIVLAIGVSFLCSMLEAVLLSITPTFTATIEEKRPRVASRIRQLKDDIDRPLSAILSLNTIAHTVGAAGAGAQAQIVFGDAAVAVFSAILTFLILVLSEIIPKTLGAMYWQAFAPLTSRVLPVLIMIMWPLVKMSQLITVLLSRGKPQPPVTREEIVALADIGRREGIIDSGDSKVVANLLKFDRLTVRDIMTPRTVAFALDEQTTIEEVMERRNELRFSRIPVYQDTIDAPTGFVLKTDILNLALDEAHDQTLASIRREVTSIVETTPLEELFDTLVLKDRHLALVTDDFGGTAGLVTLEDLIETLLGEEIVDEGDSIADLQAYARKKWEQRTARRQGPKPDAS
ncbi:CNNM domain-containing protein [Pelagibacterium halotolerans]|uniref:Hemolysin n=1 Tax=Pelagibacterium halotolerans (strain DSM 22347 / JCM 15775 / CGMCC 1.7692 / B2) TaxID=1082931 RepID=G4R665_PELHB|nr:hemolysin family protein [Pelagibacterium halotolerans]AEQ52158.1 hemolysin [Pelagibacterium halotolerans B2]QJR18078.1 HlyC/CorC family transporter [Pelagibacterium halotolerans]SDZ84722.1 Hemolysin, contains CBS domains [Pelagibacterium halotolerans]